MTTDDQYRTALDAVLSRVERTIDAVDGDVPYVADPETGEWDTTPDGNWAGGHWAGLLWLATDRATDERSRETFETAARRATDVVIWSMPSNTPFCGLTFHYAGFRGYDVTGDRSLFGLGLRGADAMVDLFCEPARQVPIGTDATDFRVATSGDSDEFPDPATESFDGLGAVDNVLLGLEVLWRAYEETGKERFRDVALSHADRHLDWYVRDDGSTWNEVAFDPETGRLERQFNELAHSDATCWARGFGWHVAGLARAYEETGATRYLDVLERSMAYYVEHAPDDLVSYWDFEAPGIPDEPRDTSAAALVAYGLVRLTGTGSRVLELRQLGHEILRSIVDEYLVVDPADERHGMITGGTFSMPAEYGVDSELVWTNYYVAYALDAVLDGTADAPV